MTEQEIQLILQSGQIDEEIAELLRQQEGADADHQASRQGGARAVGNVIVPNWTGAVGGMFDRGRAKAKAEKAEAGLTKARETQMKSKEAFIDAALGRSLSPVAVTTPRVGVNPVDRELAAAGAAAGAQMKPPGTPSANPMPDRIPQGPSADPSVPPPGARPPAPPAAPPAAPPVAPPGAAPAPAGPIPVPMGGGSGLRKPGPSMPFNLDALSGSGDKTIIDMLRGLMGGSK